MSPSIFIFSLHGYTSFLSLSLSRLSLYALSLIIFIHLFFVSSPLFLLSLYLLLLRPFSLSLSSLYPIFNNKNMLSLSLQMHTYTLIYLSLVSLLHRWNLFSQVGMQMGLVLLNWGSLTHMHTLYLFLCLTFSHFLLALYHLSLLVWFVPLRPQQYESLVKNIYLRVNQSKWREDKNIDEILGDLPSKTLMKTLNTIETLKSNTQHEDTPRKYDHIL